MKIILYIRYNIMFFLEHNIIPKDIKKLFRRLAKLFHPDRNENNEIK